MNEMIVSSLIGLNGAQNNHGATGETDTLLLEGLTLTFDKISIEKAEEFVRAIHRAKGLIAPDCSSCMNRCGNTDDYDMSEFRAGDPELKAAKTRMLQAASLAAKRLLTAGKEEVPQELHTALSYFKFDYPMEYYDKLVASLDRIAGENT